MPAIRKLSDEQMQEAYRLYVYHGYSLRDLAKKYHIGITTAKEYIDRVNGNRSKKKETQIRKPERYDIESKQKTQEKRINLAKQLIEIMSDFALVDGWTEEFLMEQLLSCGLQKNDFVKAGYKSFYDDYYNTNSKDVI